MEAKRQEYSIADYVVGRRKVKHSFFDQIKKIIDWQPIRVIIEKAYTKGKKRNGRPCHDALVLFRIELLRTWYGLSDYEVENQVNDRLSFSTFAGISMDDSCPDSTTICRFRNSLVAGGVYDELLAEINRQLETKGAIVKTGAIVDASVTDSPRRPRGKKSYIIVEDRSEEEQAAEAETSFAKEAEKPNVDGEARWTKKMGEARFGYKRHTVTDTRGNILAEETTPANESDTKHLTDVVDKADLPAGTPVMADKGYYSRENREALRQRKLRPCIMHKADRGHKLTDLEKLFNRRVSKYRYVIERTFGSIRRWFSGGTARYVGLAKTHAQHLLEAIAHNLYRAPGIIVSEHLL